MRAPRIRFLLPLLVVCACRGEEVPPPPPAAAQSPAAAPDSAQLPRAVAFTYDDLPASRDGAYGLRRMEAVTARLVDGLVAEGIPAIGFVNERKLTVAGEESERTALLRRWVQAGLELGNHSYSHRSLFVTPLAEYQADVLAGERVTRRLLAEVGARPRYYRHPYLNTGPDLRTKEAFERFLAEHDYEVAPVTIDDDDVTYALAYDLAVARGDTAAMRRIGEDFVRYMDETFAYHEELSRELFGREPAQTVLLHANELNADYLDELAAMLRRRGYRFVSLEEALRDPAYDSEDRYTGRRGLSWLQRWAITRGTDPGTEPQTPGWVAQAAR